MSRSKFPQARPNRILSNGYSVERFENAAAEVLGARYAVACSSGTIALYCAFRALGISGKHVAVPAMTWRSTAEAVAMAGGVPVFFDCRADDFHMVEPSGVDAIAVNDCFGLPAEIDRWERLGVTVVYDSASAFGSHYKGFPIGARGIHTFSLSPTKTLTSNEGGLVTCQDEGFADECKGIRRWAGRMTEYNAECALSGLPALSDTIEAKREISQRYAAACEKYGWSYQEKSSHRAGTHKDFCAVLATQHERDALRARLEDAGVETRIYFTPCNEFFPGAARDDLSETYKLFERSICLPSWPGVDQDFIFQVLEDFQKCQEKKTA